MFSLFLQLAGGSVPLLITGVILNSWTWVCSRTRRRASWWMMWYLWKHKSSSYPLLRISEFEVENPTRVLHSKLIGFQCTYVQLQNKHKLVIYCNFHFIRQEKHQQKFTSFVSSTHVFLSVAPTKETEQLLAIYHHNLWVCLHIIKPAFGINVQINALVSS